MTSKIILRRAWRSLWELRPHHDVPGGARLAVVSLLALALALELMTLVAVFGTVDPPGWWWASLLPNVGISLCIMYSLFGTLRLAERHLPAPLVERMSDVRDLRAGLALGAISLFGIILGMTVGFTIVPIMVGFDIGGMFISLPAAMMKFAVFLLFIMGINWAWWRAHLRLPQGQIEPHLLFNTLANVQSLMDYDPPRAKRMLETFSGYLRAGLCQLRATDSTLGAELDMARSYLALMQIRMEERLNVRIEAAARRGPRRCPR